MILVDTSIWIDHLQHSDPRLVDLLTSSAVVQHPMVIGELAMGSLANRIDVFRLLGNLPAVSVATHDEVLTFVERHRMHSRALGLVDAHLLASVVITPGARLWTRDKRLRAAAAELQVSAD